MTESILRTSAEKSGLTHKKFNIFLDQKSPACKIFISIIQTLNLSLHCSYAKAKLRLSFSVEVNKELLIRILQ